MSGWIILRTSGRRTLPLAASLAEDGYEAWTPAETKRAPRSRARYRVPMMPTFVFARSQHLVDLLQLAEMPVKPRRGKRLRQPAHEDFSVFHYYDRIPIVDDAELDNLRRLEARSTPPPIVEPYRRGQSVVVTQGVACGLGGQVVRSDGESTLVCFGGHMRMKISTFILKPALARAA